MKSPSTSPVLAVDPGTTDRAFAFMRGRDLLSFGKVPNDDLVKRISKGDFHGQLAVEMIASYGMAVGRTVFETCTWLSFSRECGQSPYIDVGFSNVWANSKAVVSTTRAKRSPVANQRRRAVLARSIKRSQLAHGGVEVIVLGGAHPGGVGVPLHAPTALPRSGRRRVDLLQDTQNADVGRHPLPMVPEN